MRAQRAQRRTPNGFIYIGMDLFRVDEAKRAVTVRSIQAVADVHLTWAVVSLGL